MFWGFSMTETMAMPAAAVVLLVASVVILLFILWSVKRRKDPTLQIDVDAPLPDLIPSLSGLAYGSLLDGNTVSLHENGALFDVLLEDIRKAERSVHFETFLWKDGVLGKRMADAFIERSRAGVQVRIMVDANGSRGMGKETAHRLREGGCKLVRYHRWRLRNIGLMNNRDHRKIAVIDGKTGYVGGHCIVDTWMGHAQDKKHFRDISARICGPAVHMLQSVFSENWVEETGELFVGEEFFPEIHKEGDVVIHTAHVSPTGSSSAVKILHHLVICCARERLLIQNPYFLPDPEAIKAFGQAVERGVDVRIMVPSPEASDFPLVQHASHFRFQDLLDVGVRLFEYEKTLLHQKVMMVDGVWCAIGSSNFDDRSFEINDEITLGFQDAALARRLEEIFEKDLEYCAERTAEEWRKRSVVSRMRDAVLYMVNEQL